MISFITISKKAGVVELIEKSLLYIYATASVLVLYFAGPSKSTYGNQLYLMYFYGLVVSRIVVD